MKFALFYEIPTAKPWKKGDEYKAIHEAMEQGILADKLGFHSFWATEHHFLKELSVSTAPEVLLSYLAAKTENLRLGHGVRLLPHAYNNPVRVAEQAATLDILSNGRLEFGVGRSATRTEMEGFGINPHETKDMQNEALGTVIRAWTEDELEFHGKYWDMPARQVVPKPLQEPHPPIWYAANSPDSHYVVGEMGLNLLSLTIGVGPEVLAERIGRYKEGVANANPIAPRVGTTVGTFTLFHCAPTVQEARLVAQPSYDWYVANNRAIITGFVDWLGDEMGEFAHKRAKVEASSGDVGGIQTFDELVDKNAVIVGDPDQCVEAARGYANAGCDVLLCLVNPHSIPHEKIMQSIELIGRHVIPEFAD